MANDNDDLNLQFRNIFVVMRREFLKREEGYRGRKDLLGMDVGYAYDGGEIAMPRRIAIRFFVRKKLKPFQLDDRIRLPDCIDGYETDVNEMDLVVPRAGVIRRRTPRAQRRNPIQPGISVSHHARGIGTIGAIVYIDGKTPAILGSAHTMTVPGDETKFKAQTVSYARQFAAADLGCSDADNRLVKGIFQPSPMDGGDIRFDLIAEVLKSVPDKVPQRRDDSTAADPLSPSIPPIYPADAAIAGLARQRMVKLHQFGSGDTVTKVDDVRLGDKLIKSGRGSGITQALVDGIGFYRWNPDDPDQVIWIDGFRLVPIADLGFESISALGDSGALWYRVEPGGIACGVGLHVDGERTEDETEFAIACHLRKALQHLSATLTPGAVPEAIQREDYEQSGQTENGEASSPEEQASPGPELRMTPEGVTAESRPEATANYPQPK